MAVLTAFAASPECAIFSDALNHASIVDGARLAARSGAHVLVFRQAFACQMLATGAFQMCAASSSDKPCLLSMAATMQLRP